LPFLATAMGISAAALGANDGNSDQPHSPVARLPDTESCVMLFSAAPTWRLYVFPLPSE
jgi:hypothetical protein